jgi:hypothetical protein
MRTWLITLIGMVIRIRLRVNRGVIELERLGFDFSSHPYQNFRNR